ncbi:uncharacterized protein TNCV_3362761 [Trichonephila clavipes]|nr:uncharacterized protein TNCV_3362761 [Trichonephila clavipes]
MIVLSWIRKESYQLKTFVANRIATIQEMTSSEQWRYVATEDNPVDFVSRGMDSLKLKTCELWWNGPKFSDEQPVPTTTNSCCSDQGSRPHPGDAMVYHRLSCLVLVFEATRSLAIVKKLDTMLRIRSKRNRW